MYLDESSGCRIQGNDSFGSIEVRSEENSEVMQPELIEALHLLIGSDTVLTEGPSVPTHLFVRLLFLPPIKSILSLIFTKAKTDTKLK